LYRQKTKNIISHENTRKWHHLKNKGKEDAEMPNIKCNVVVALAKNWGK